MLFPHSPSLPLWFNVQVTKEFEKVCNEFLSPSRTFHIERGKALAGLGFLPSFLPPSLSPPFFPVVQISGLHTRAASEAGPQSLPFLQQAPDQQLCVQLIKNVKGNHHLGSLFGFRNLLVFSLSLHSSPLESPSIHCPWPMPRLGHLGMQISFPRCTDIAVHEYCNAYSATHPIQLCLSLLMHL